MKLKKLLPLAGLTGVAAVAAPLVTSCADKGTAITWESGDDDIVLDPVEEGVEFASETKMLEGYLSAIDIDKTIMSKDIVKYVVNRFNAATANDESLKSISVRTDKIDVEKHLVSIYASAEIKVSGPDGAKSSLFTVEWTMKNVEYVGEIVGTEPSQTIFVPKLCYVTEEGTSAEWFDYLVELSKDNKWSFEISESSSLGTTVELKLNHSNIGDLSRSWIESLLDYGYEIQDTGIYYESTYYSNASINE